MTVPMEGFEELKFQSPVRLVCLHARDVPIQGVRNFDDCYQTINTCIHGNAATIPEPP